MISFIVEEGGQHRRLDFGELPIHIGRAEEAEIRLISTRCSRHHARIEASPEGYLVVDLDSSNGTFRNGERILRGLLNRGDRLEAGDAILTFLGGDDLLRVAAPALALPGFTVLDDLGEGVVSRVFLARQEALGRKVAVKVLKERWRDCPSVAASFQRRARLQARLHHPALASGIDVAQFEGIPCFVLEYLEGDTLAARVRSQLSLEPLQVTRVIGDVLRLMDYVHGQGQVIAGLNPSAVLLGDADETWVTSLGFPLPNTGMFPPERVEELAYLAPEAVENPEAGGVAGDLFQVGALAAALLTGRPPRRRGTVEDMLAAARQGVSREVLGGRKPVPPLLREFVLQLMAEDPGDRPTSASAALGQLDLITGELRAGRLKLAAAVADQTDREAAPGRKRLTTRFKVLSTLISCGILALLHGGFFMLWHGCKGSEDREGTFTTAGAVAPSPGEENPGPDDLPPGPEPGPTESAEEVAALWTVARDQAEKHLARGDHAEALALTRGFASRYPSTPEASQALDLAARAQRVRLERAEELLAAGWSQIRARHLAGARQAVGQARPLASEVAPHRLGELERALEALEQESLSAPEGPSSTRPPLPERPPPPAGPPGEPRSPQQIELLITQALARPFDQALRRRALEALQNVEAGAQNPCGRLLQAVVASLADAVAVLREKGRGQHVVLSLQDGTQAAGVLEGADGEGVGVRTEERLVRLAWEQVAPAEQVRILSGLEPSLDRYLARAYWNVIAGFPGEAWFDLHGARMLCGGDSVAQSLIEAHLEKLVREGRSPPADPSRDGITQ